jgi:hypothetical protein
LAPIRRGVETPVRGFGLNRPARSSRDAISTEDPGQEKIRDKLDAGLLPREAPTTMREGHGHGSRCDGCDGLIHPAQVACEMASGDRVYRLHLGCAGVWDTETNFPTWRQVLFTRFV